MQFGLVHIGGSIVIIVIISGVLGFHRVQFSLACVNVGISSSGVVILAHRVTLLITAVVGFVAAIAAAIIGAVAAAGIFVFAFVIALLSVTFIVIVVLLSVISLSVILVLTTLHMPGLDSGDFRLLYHMCTGARDSERWRES
ncbi:hypothetical protein BDZ97DRAFT_1923107 [Flammula alnicola]|nr:hypothetical protein BDZ97DRAFT_1923107 [Flammula alnicola]